MYTLFAESTAPTSLADNGPFTNELSTRSEFDDLVTYDFSEEISPQTVRKLQTNSAK